MGTARVIGLESGGGGRGLCGVCYLRPHPVTEAITVALE